MHIRELLTTLSEVGQDDYPTMRHDARAKLERLGVSFEKPKMPPYDPVAEAAKNAKALLSMVGSFGYINDVFIDSRVLETLNKVVDAQVKT